MATAVNAPITFKLVATAGNSGTNYEFGFDTSINNWQTALGSACTPIWTALNSATFPAVHWRIRVVNQGYATPAEMYPYSPNSRASVTGTCGHVEITKGRQSFYNLVAADFSNAQTLATPVV